MEKTQFPASLFVCLPAVAAILSVACQQIEPTSLNADTLPVKVNVSGHARYIATGKFGTIQSPEIVDCGTDVNIFYGVPNPEGETEYAHKTVKTDENGFFSAEIGCPAGKTMSIKVNCSILGDSYATNEDGKYVSSQTWFFAEVKKDVACGKAAYFKLDMAPAANISEDGLVQPD